MDFRSIPWPLPHVARKILALGAEMQATFAYYDHGDVVVCGPFGSAADVDTLASFAAHVQRCCDEHGIPDIILADLHPGYATTDLAFRLGKQWNRPVVQLQHHAAHAAAILAEYNQCNSSAPVIVCDGLGYGDDGTIWGGEIFQNHRRIGHLEPQIQLGGDAATFHPARMAFGILYPIVPREALPGLLHNYFTERELSALGMQYQQRFNAPLSSSTGRILDAAAFLLGLVRERESDGSPAIALDKHATEPYPLSPVIKHDVLQTTPLFDYLVNHLSLDSSRLAATVLAYLVDGLLAIARNGQDPTIPVYFTGGVAHSRFLQKYCAGKNVLFPQQWSCGDSSICLGKLALLLTDPRYEISRR